MPKQNYGCYHKGLRQECAENTRSLKGKSIRVCRYPKGKEVVQSLGSSSSSRRVGSVFVQSLQGGNLEEDACCSCFVDVGCFRLCDGGDNPGKRAGSW